MYKKILIINPFGVGDVLFTTAVIRALKEAYPEVKIGYLSNRRTASILEDNPRLDKVFVYERDEFQAWRKKSFFLWLKNYHIFLKSLKKENFDLALDFSLNPQFGFFSWSAGIKTRAGYDFKKRGRFLNKKVTFLGYKDKHVVEYYARLLKFLNIDLPSPRLELFLNPEDLKRISGILEKEGVRAGDSLVGLVPGAGRSWGKDAFLKHWPLERFAQLADKIIDNLKAKIIIVGDFSEKEIGRRITGLMKNRAMDFTGRTSLGECAALLSKLKVLVTNDGGPLHMAVALGIKTVSIFGPVDENVYGPYPQGERHAVITQNLSCRPCYKDFKMPPCFLNRRCITDITVQEVFAATKEMF